MLRLTLTGATLCLICVLLAGCGGVTRTLPPGFTAERDIKPIEAAPPDVLGAFEAGLNREYLLGPGDVVEIVAPVYPEIAGEQTVSPEGEMTVYPAGGVRVGGLTRAEAEKALKESLGKYYNPLALTLRIKSYENNQVLVLGRVANPGAVKFRARPNLLEALARAGAFSVGVQDRYISRCDVIRGKDQILRVSLDEMLKGGAGGRNLDLANNDIVYIPENTDNSVYVMGEVNKPGVYEIRTSMSLLNAVMMAGGPTETAVSDKIRLVRDNGRGEAITVSLDRMTKTADFAGNVLLARNDIVVVPRNILGDINYYFRMINPFTQLFLIGYTMGTKK